MLENNGLSEETIKEIQRIMSKGAPKKGPNDATIALYNEWMGKLRKPLEIELNNDKIYYELHPEHSFRMRMSYPNEHFYFRLVSSFAGEYIEESDSIAVIIKRTAPAEIIRLPIVYSHLRAPTDEELLALSQEELTEIWEELIQLM